MACDCNHYTGLCGDPGCYPKIDNGVYGKDSKGNKIGIHPEDRQWSDPVIIAKGADPFDRQVGGDHYKDLPIQPLEYALANKLGIIEHAVVKYISRYENKGGKQDLLKIIDYVEKLIHIKYPTD